MTFNDDSCPVCHSHGRPHMAVGAHTLYRCSECSLSYCHPAPSDEELEAYYATYHLGDSAGGVYDAVESRMQADFPSKLQMVEKLQNLRGNGRLLDVGCGKGFFVDYCVKQGLHAEGIDLSTSAIEYATTRQKGIFHRGNLLDASTLEGQFNAITLWATIEHVRDPLRLLRDAYERIEHGGMLHLDTGIGFDWLDRWLPGNVQWYDPPQHLFVFSERSMRILCETAGFRVVRYTRSFERSPLRHLLRRIRNGTTAIALRSIADIMRLTASMKKMSRLPLGNLQSASLLKE